MAEPVGLRGNTPVVGDSEKDVNLTLTQVQEETAPNSNTGTWLGRLKAAFTSIFSSKKSDTAPVEEVQAGGSSPKTIKEKMAAFKAGATKAGNKLIAHGSAGLKAVGSFLLTLAEAAGKGTQLLLGGIFFAVGSALMGGYTAGKGFKPRGDEANIDAKSAATRLSAAFEGFKEEGGKGLTAGGKWMQTVCRMAKEAIQARRDAAADAAE